MYGNHYYQAPYPQAPNPYAERLTQMAPQPPRDNLIRVTGMDGARAYQMPPNSSVALFDGGQDVFYVKTTDGAGFPTIRAYSFQPVQDAQAGPSGDYVTRAEFNELKEAVLSGQQPIREQQPDAEQRRGK